MLLKVGPLLKLVLLVAVVSTLKRERRHGVRRNSDFCGVTDLSTLYMSDCPDGSTLPLAGLNGTCQTGPGVIASFDGGWSVNCADPDAMMVIYGPSWGNGTRGYNFAYELYCNDDGQSIVGDSEWGVFVKFVPGVDSVACYSGMRRQIVEVFRQPTCDSQRFSIIQNSTSCPDFSTMAWYSPRNGTSEPISIGESENLRAGCQKTLAEWNFPRLDLATAFPYSGYTCRADQFLIRNNTVIPLRLSLCEETQWTAVTIDNIRLPIDAATDRIFCSWMALRRPLTCHDLIPTSACPSNIAEYTSDLATVPYSVPGLVPANPECLQNYTIWHYSPYAVASGYSIRCYQPGTDINSPTRASSRMLILVEDHGKYHLTRTLGCRAHMFTMDEQYTARFTPEAKFTCIDSLAAYDSMMTANGYNPSVWDWDA